MRTIDGLRAGAAVVVLAITAGSAMAQQLETRGAYCNDNYFNSDGAGITGCMNFALHYGADALFDTGSGTYDTIGIGITGATPEQRSNAKTDPLESLGRITSWYGREFEAESFDYAIVARTGIEGGAADDLAINIHDALHDHFGVGTKGLTSTHDTRFIAGVSGWARKDYGLSDSGSWATSFTPYMHAALGNDVIEGGGGLMLSLQPSGEAKGLALLTPLNGAYAPTFGGDGIGLFAGVRGVALETLYGDHANHFIAEAGMTAQATLWDFAVIGASASCTTEPYDGAGKPDCKATLQAGGLF